VEDDASAGDSIADQRKEEVPTVDICESPDVGLDARDDKFGLSVSSILSVFTKFTV
jgi:hypothetical protein